MIEPTQEKVYRLCGIEQPRWYVTGGDMNVRPPAGNQSESQVAMRWIKLLGGRAYRRTSDGSYDVYESGGSTLRVKVG